MSKVTLSEFGLALILLENEVDNNEREVRRRQRRFDEANRATNEAKQAMFEAVSRFEKNRQLLQQIKERI